MKDFLYCTIIGFLVGFSYKSINRNSNNSRKIESMKFESKMRQDTILSLSKELKKHESHIYRMQRIAGIKNPDSVFTWKEKVTHPINIKALLK